MKAKPPSDACLAALQTCRDALSVARTLGDRKYQAWQRAVAAFVAARECAPRGSWQAAMQQADISLNLAQKLRSSIQWAVIRSDRDPRARGQQRWRAQREIIATPDWVCDSEGSSRYTAAQAELAARESVYMDAERLTEERGERYDVDHIVALCCGKAQKCSRDACGLHVSWNLRPYRKAFNEQKGADMPPEHQQTRDEFDGYASVDPLADDIDAVPAEDWLAVPGDGIAAV